MHHLVLLNPPGRKRRHPRKGRMPAALAKYWRKRRAGKKSPSIMKHRKRRKRVVSSHRRRRIRRSVRRRSHRRRVVHRRVRHRRRRRAVRAIRRRHHRKHHRRKKYRLVTRHVIRRVRVNSSGGAVSMIGGVIAGQLAFSLLDSLIVAKAVTSATSTSTAGTKLMISSAVSGGIGLLGWKMLRRSHPSLALGVASGAAMAVVAQLLVAGGITLLGTQPGNALASNTPQAGTAYGGTTGASPAGTGSTGAAAYLGARRRRMGAYLSGQMPVKSLVGAVTPARRTFAHSADNLSRRVGNIYSSGPAFARDAWAR